METENNGQKSEKHVKDYILWFLMIVFACCMIALYILHINLERSVNIQQGAEDRNLHGPLCLSGLILVSLGAIMYRFLPGYKTRVVKYIHMVFQTLGVLFLVIGYVFGLLADLNRTGVVRVRQEAISQGEHAAEHSVHMSNTAHVTLGYIVLAAILLQYILASFIFAYLYPNRKARQFYAPYHDMFGLWIFLGLVGCYLTGLFYLYDRDIGCCSAQSDTPRDYLYYITIPAYVGFLIVYAVILCPYYEWDWVGPV